MPELQGTFLAPSSGWRPPKMSELPEWVGARRVAVDVETRDEQLRELGVGARRPNCYAVGFSFAIEDGPAAYLPIRHFGGDNLPEEEVLRYLRDQARSFRGEIVGANLGYDLDYLLNEGINFQPSRFRDVQVAGVMVDELQNSYSLNSLAERVGLEGKEEETLAEAARAHGVDPKRDLWRLPARLVGAYAERDAVLSLRVLEKLDRCVDREDVRQIWDLESDLLPVLVRMRRRGVRVSFERLSEIERFSVEEERKAFDRVRELTGVRIAVGDAFKNEALAKIFREIGVQPELTPKTRKPKITSDFLKSVHHPAAEAVLRARKVNKLRTTFVESVRRYAVGDRVHCTFNQVRKTEDYGEDEEESVGAAYGRISVVDPNLQQQPARDPELGPMWRKVYVADEGGLWCGADFSQQEPRWTTHYAELLGCTGAEAAAEQYRRDPRTDNHTMMTVMVHGQATWDGWDKAARKTNRDYYKQIYLGLSYGMGAAKLCRKLGLPTEWVHDARRGKMVEVAGPEGRALFELFNRKAPFLRELADRASYKAARTGFIRTVLGRRCRFPRKEDGSFDWTHKALNRLIQGSSADQMKKAMILADAAGFPLQLQVHDELDLTISAEHEGSQLAEIMVDAVPCNVPHVVDLDIGKSWGGD